MTMNSFESMLRRHAWELGFAVEDMRKRVDEATVDSDHGDRLRSLVTLRDALGSDGHGPHTVIVRWAHRRGWSGFTARGQTAPSDVDRIPAPVVVWELRRNIYDGEPFFQAAPGGVLLWALALELDEDKATLTREQVCRECSGRRERIVALDQGVFVDPHFHVSCRRNGWTPIESSRDRPGTTVRMHASSVREERRRGNYDPHSVGNVYVPPTRMVVRPCPFCWTGRGRPETVSLEWLVRRLAAVGDFRAELAGWPEAWQAQLDAWQASGETHWRAQWWLAFAEWAHAGKVPDQHQLARLLAVRMRLRALPVERQRWPSVTSDEYRARIADGIFAAMQSELPEFVGARDDWTLAELRLEPHDDGYRTAYSAWERRGRRELIEARASIIDYGGEPRVALMSANREW